MQISMANKACRTKIPRLCKMLDRVQGQLENAIHQKIHMKIPCPKGFSQHFTFIKVESDLIHFKFWKKAIGGSNALTEIERKRKKKPHPFILILIHVFPCRSLEKTQEYRNYMLLLYTSLHCFLTYRYVIQLIPNLLL